MISRWTWILFEIVSAQAFVAQLRDAFDHEPVGRSSASRAPAVPCWPQSACAVPPPDVRGRRRSGLLCEAHARDAGAWLGASPSARRAVARGEFDLGEIGEEHELEYASPSARAASYAAPDLEQRLPKIPFLAIEPAVNIRTNAASCSGRRRWIHESEAKAPRRREMPHLQLDEGLDELCPRPRWRRPAGRVLLPWRRAALRGDTGRARRTGPPGCG